MALRLIIPVLASLVPFAALADITVDDPYFRVSRPGAPAGAAFMVLTNTGDAKVTLTGALSAAAPRIMIHTHVDAGDGIVKMLHVHGGLDIPAGGTLHLKRGGDHLMFMGLGDTWETGQSLSVTLEFDGAAPLILDIPVDNERMDMHH